MYTPRRVDFTHHIISVDDLGTIEVPLTVFIMVRTATSVVVKFKGLEAPFKGEFVFKGNNKEGTIKKAFTKLGLCKSDGVQRDTHFYMVEAAETLGLNNFKIV